MERGSDISSSRGFWRQLVGWWFRLSRRKIRLLHSGEIGGEGPTLYAVSQPASFRAAAILATAFGRSVRCLVPSSEAERTVSHLLARKLGFILYKGESPVSEASLREAINVLAGGGAVVVFADQSVAGQSSSCASTSTAGTLVWRAEAQHLGRRVEVRPVHLYLPEPAAHSREILIYVDSALARPEGLPAAPQPDVGAQAYIAAIDARFRENAFQLRPRDLKYFLIDLEEVLRAGLQEEWESRPDWKQDTEGFVLSRLVTDWVEQTNFLNPGRVVSLRQSLDDYRRLQQQCALRRLEVEGAESLPGSGWQRAIVWLETLAGLPIALYGLVNHLAIGLVLWLGGSFRDGNPRPRSTEWTLRVGVALGFYTVQIFLVAHHWGRAAAGYYAPTLPVSGAYLFRYRWVLSRQARLALISLTIPSLTAKIKRLRHLLLKEIDQALGSCEEHG